MIARYSDLIPAFYGNSGFMMINVWKRCILGKNGRWVMEKVFRMAMTELGSFNLLEHLVDDTEGLRACQDYGRALGEKLGK